VAPRQEATRSQLLLQHPLARAGLRSNDVDWVDTARTESDAALAVLDNKTDATLCLRAMAEQLRLGFVPRMLERFDISVDGAAWFDPLLQRLFGFCRSTAFPAKAEELVGYDLSGLGHVQFNGG
jgi:putative molybdopterin biosynthesis protein